jgi:ATP-binding cassette subfamily F protein 3
VKLLLDPPNLLLMDEPTTHLDLSSVEALLYALDQFEGTLIFISHDVYFIRTLANHVVHVNDGRLTYYPGGYDYYLDKIKAASARAALTASGSDGLPGVQDQYRGLQQPGQASSRKGQKRVEAEERQVRSRRRREQQQIVNRLEKEICALEQRQIELTAELEKPETYQQPGRAMEVNRELLALRQDLAELTPQWESAATTLAGLDLV